MFRCFVKWICFLRWRCRVSGWKAHRCENGWKFRLYSQLKNSNRSWGGERKWNWKLFFVSSTMLIVFFQRMVHRGYITGILIKSVTTWERKRENNERGTIDSFTDLSEKWKMDSLHFYCCAHVIYKAHVNFELVVSRSFFFFFFWSTSSGRSYFVSILWRSKNAKNTYNMRKRVKYPKYSNYSDVQSGKFSA